MFFKKIFLALILGVSLFSISCAGQQDEIDFTLKDLDDNNIALSDYRGKVVFLDFWATWCPPCVMAIPEVEKLYEEYKDNENVVIFGINMAENRNDIDKFLTKNKINYRVLLGDNKTASKFSIRGIPTFIIIDQDGKIYNKFVGFTPGSLIEWKNSIEKILN